MAIHGRIIDIILLLHVLWWMQLATSELTNARGGVARSFGCERISNTSPLPLGEAVLHTLGVRRYYLTLPSSYKSDSAHSLVLSFHGIASQPTRAPFFKEVIAEATEGVIFAFPEGLADASEGDSRRSFNGSGSVGSPGPAGATCELKQPISPCCESCQRSGGCRDPCWLTTCADDVGFVLALLDELESTLCINTGSLHAIGFSNGGWFGIELGTNPRVAHRFKSIVSAAGVPFKGFNKIPAMLPGARFLGIYGRNDSLVPAFGNRISKPDEAVARTGYIFSTWENTTRVWAREFGCMETLHDSSFLHAPAWSPLQCYEYDDCPGNMVAVCLWDGPHAFAPGALEVAWQLLFDEEFEFNSSQIPRPVHDSTTSAPILLLALVSVSVGIWAIRRTDWLWSKRIQELKQKLLV